MNVVHHNYRSKLNILAKEDTVETSDELGVEAKMTLNRLTKNHHLNIELVKGENLEALIDEWEALAAIYHSQYSIFQMPQWCLAWHLAHPKKAMLIAVVRQEGKIKLLLPLMVDVRFGCRVLELFTAPECEYGIVLANEGSKCGSAFEALLDFVRQSDKFDLIELINSPKGYQDWVDDFCDLSISSDLISSSHLDLSEFSFDCDYLDSLSRSRRKNLKYKIRKLLELGVVNCQVKRIDAKYIKQNFSQISGWKHDLFDQNGLVGSRFNSVALERHLIELAKYDGQQIELLASEITLNGNLIACDILLASNSYLYGYITSRDLDYARFNLGEILNYTAISYAIENRFRGFDVLGGPSDHKDSFCNRTTKLNNLYFVFSKKGWLLMQLYRLRIRANVKTVFYKTPVRGRRQLKKILQMFLPLPQ